MQFLVQMNWKEGCLATDAKVLLHIEFVGTLTAQMHHEDSRKRYGAQRFCDVTNEDDNHALFTGLE